MSFCTNCKITWKKSTAVKAKARSPVDFDGDWGQRLTIMGCDILPAYWYIVVISLCGQIKQTPVRGGHGIAELVDKYHTGPRSHVYQVQDLKDHVLWKILQHLCIGHADSSEFCIILLTKRPFYNSGSIASVRNSTCRSFACGLTVMIIEDDFPNILSHPEFHILHSFVIALTLSCQSHRPDCNSQ